MFASLPFPRRGRFALATLLTLVALAVLPAAALASGEGVFAGSPGSSAPSPTGATITSDKQDYPPGATVTLSGAGWVPGETVDIVVDDDGVSANFWRHEVTVTADANGQVSDQFDLADWFVANYYVSATGAQSGEATHSFTDSPKKISGSSHEGQSKVAGVLGGYASGNVTQYSEGESINFRFTLDATHGPASGKLEVRFSRDDGACTFFDPSFALGAIENLGGPQPTVTVDSGPTASGDGTEWIVVLNVNYATTFDHVTNAARVNYTLTLSDEAGECNGSSQHSRLGEPDVGAGDVDQSGAQNVPVPANQVVEFPEITATKLIDRDGDGTFEDTADAGEYRFTLDGTTQLLTDANGQVVFQNVTPDGPHTVTEQQVDFTQGTYNFDSGVNVSNCVFVGSTAGPIVASGTTSTDASCTFRNEDRPVIDVTASSHTVTFGDAAPSITCTYDATDFVDGDDEADLTTSPNTGTTTYDQGDEVGDGELTGGDAGKYGTSCASPGATDEKYDFNYIGGAVTVQKKTIDVTASSHTVTFGDAAPSITCTYDTNDFVGGDDESDLTSSPNTGATTYDQGDEVGDGELTGGDAGKYGTSCSAAGASDDNYDFNYIDGAVTVQKKALDVTASSHTVTFGDAPPAITCTYTGFVGSDDESDLTSSPNTGTTTYDQGDEVGDGELTGPNAGKYGTTCAGAGPTDDNYSFNFVDGAVTVQKKTIDVTASSHTVTFGDAPPAVTCTYDTNDFVGGDDESDLTSSPNTGATTYDQGDEVGDGELTGGDAGKYGTSCSAAGATDDNYDFNYIDGAVTVQKKTIDVQASSHTVTFGDAAPSITCTYTGFVGGDDESDLTSSPNTGATTYDQGDEVGDGELTGPNAGKYGTSCSAAGASDDNYDFNFLPGAVTVQKKTIDVTASSHTVTFGDAPPAITCTYDTNDFVGGDDESDLTSSPNTGATTYDQGDEVGDGELTGGDAGKYGTSCSAAGATDDNYDFNYVDGAVTVTKKTIDVTASSHTVTFGDAPPAITCTYDTNDFVGGDDESDLTSSPNTGSTTYDQGDEVGDGELTGPNAGKYGTTCSAAGATDDNYDFNYVDGAVTVTKKTIDVTASSHTVTFGDAAPSITCTYDTNDFVGGDDEADLTTSPNTGATTYDQGDEVGDGELTGGNAGKYGTSCSTPGATDDNYDFNYVPGAVTVQKKTIDVEASSHTVTFGDAAPSITCTYDTNDFVGGDDEADLTSSPNTGATTYDQGDEVGDGELTGPNAGKYGTSCSAAGATDDNYDFNYVDGAVTVQKKALDVTASSHTVTYGDAPPSISCTYTGFVGSDDESDLTSSPNTGTTTYDQGDGVGGTPYDTTCSGAGPTDDNYAFNFVDGAVTVQKKQLTVTASSHNVTYGDAVPAGLDCDFSGFVLGDDENDLDVKPLPSTTYDQGDGVGGSPYPTRCDQLPAAPPSSDDNYSFSFVNGAITVGKKQLTVTASSHGVAFGDPVPAGLDCDFSGFVPGDDENDLDVKPLPSTTYDQGDAVGNYPTRCDQLPAAPPSSDDNYSFNFVNGQITVRAKTLTVTASSHNVTYGDAVPAGLDCDYSGFEPGDDETDLDVAPLPSTTYDQGDGVGGSPYVTRCDQLPTAPPSSDDNYAFNFVNGAITVGKKQLTVTASSHGVTYGDAVPAGLDCDFSGFVPGDDEADLDVAPLPSTTYDQGDGVGGSPYPTRCDQLPAAPPSSDDNYSFNFVNGAITVAKKQLTVTASSHPNLTYGDAVPAGLDCDFSGFEPGDDETDLDVAPQPSTTYDQGDSVSGSPYPTRCDQLPAAPPSSDDNYSFSFVNGAITVAKKQLTVTASNHFLTYGDAKPTVNCSFDSSQFVGNDDVNDVNTPPVGTTAYDQGDGVAASPYSTTCSAPGGSDDDYSFAYTDGQVFLFKAVIDVTASSHTVTYGDPPPTITCEYDASDFKLGDDGDDIDTAPTGSSTYNQGDPVGNYVTECSGGQDDNYTFNFQPGGVEGGGDGGPGAIAVIPKPVNGTFKAADKVYDGNTSATASDRQLTGVLAGDDVTLDGGTATFPNKNVGTYNVPLVGASLDGADKANYTLSGVADDQADITPKPVNGTYNAANKVYDGNTSATASNRALTGVLAGETVTLEGGTATFPNENVGSYSVPLTGATLGGADKDNYTLAGVANDPADITPKPVNGTFKAADKVYDGNTSATASDRALTGVVAGDAVTLTGGTASFPSKDVGSYNLSLTGATLGGADKDNYTLAGVADDPADITPRPVTGTFNAANKVYDGNTSATASNRGLTGVLEESNGASVSSLAKEDVTLTGGTATFDNKNAGTNKNVSLNGATLSGADKGNYTLTGVNDAKADITPAPITGSFKSADKVYDANTSATASDRALAGVLAGDTVTLTGGTAAFPDKNVGGYDVALTGASLDGADKGNYSLTGVSTARAAITPAPLTGAFTAADKDYDGNTDATITGRSLTGVIGSEDVSLIDGTAAFDDPEPGVGKPVAGSGFGLAGADKGNYELIKVENTTATIRQRPAPPADPPPPVIDTTNNCLRRPVLAFVRGKRIKRVVFFLDGEKIARVTKKDAKRRFSTLIERKTLGDGDHRLQAKVFFFKTKQTYLLSLKLKRCVDKKVPVEIKTTGGVTDTCPAKTFLAFVKGDTISKVRYTLNGEFLKTSRVADWKKRYAVKIDPTSLGAGPNILEAAITFIRGSKTVTATLTRELPACGKATSRNRD